MWRLTWLGGLVLGLHTLTSYLEENLFKKLQFRLLFRILHAFKTLCEPALALLKMLSNISAAISRFKNRAC